LRRIWEVIQAVYSSNRGAGRVEEPIRNSRESRHIKSKPRRRAVDIRASLNTSDPRRNSIAVGAQRTPTEAVTRMEEFRDHAEGFLAGQAEKGIDRGERSTVESPWYDYRRTYEVLTKYARENLYILRYMDHDWGQRYEGS
jgi:hypothetical protein